MSWSSWWKAVWKYRTIASEIGVRSGHEAGKLDAEMGGITLQESSRFVTMRTGNCQCLRRDRGQISKSPRKSITLLGSTWILPDHWFSVFTWANLYSIRCRPNLIFCFAMALRRSRSNQSRLYFNYTISIWQNSKRSHQRTLNAMMYST